MPDEKTPAVPAKPKPGACAEMAKTLRDMPVRGGVVRISPEFRDMCVAAIGKNKVSAALAAIKPIVLDPIVGSLQLDAELAAKVIRHLSAAAKPAAPKAKAVPKAVK